jgi:hypothetical protein
LRTGAQAIRLWGTVFAEIIEVISWVLYGTGPREGRKGRRTVIALALMVVLLAAIMAVIVVF